jgi:hypothetical protein
LVLKQVTLLDQSMTCDIKNKSLANIILIESEFQMFATIKERTKLL